MKFSGVAMILASGAIMSTALLAVDAQTSKLTSKPSGELAVNFLDTVFNKKEVSEAFDKYVAPPYTQHNPLVADGIDGGRNALSGIVKKFPAYHYDIKRVLVDGDLVATHSHVTIGPDDRGRAIVDLFRVKDGKIVEHWDVIQPVSETSANKNTMF